MKIFRNQHPGIIRKPPDIWKRHVREIPVQHAPNQEECIKIIEYLRKIGITCINELLIYEIDLFKKDLDYIIKKISKFNIPVFVNIVNDEYTAIENIYNVD